MAFRIVFTAPADGPWNMAVDESLLASAAAGQTTLRFYGWKPATLSLGYFQSLDSRTTHAASRSCDIVRRASGGGAILHDRELTYSFATPVHDRFGQRAEQVYDLFHRTLCDVLARWKIHARFVGDTPHSASEDSFLCFERRSAMDLVVAGAKILGSAQRRHQGALLQHGSLLLAASRFAPELPGLAELTGQTLELHEVCEDWLPRLEAAMGLCGERGELTDSELLLAEQWQRERFANDVWTARR